MKITTTFEWFFFKFTLDGLEFDSFVNIFLNNGWDA